MYVLYFTRRRVVVKYVIVLHSCNRVVILLDNDVKPVISRCFFQRKITDICSH